MVRRNPQLLGRSQQGNRLDDYDTTATQAQGAVTMADSPIPPGDRQPRWAQLLRDGAGTLAHTALQFGNKANDVRRMIMARWVGTSWATADAVVKRVTQAMEAARIFEDRMFGGRVPLMSIPISPLMKSVTPGAGQPAFRIESNVQFKMPGEAAPAWTKVIVEYSAMPTQDELDRRILELWGQIASGAAGSARVRGNVDPTPMRIDTIMIWRS